MTDSRLDLERFDELLDVHGAQLARWPDELRPAAERLLASSAEARELLARAARVAALLDALPEVLPSSELSARIASLPVRHRQGWAVWWPFGNPLAPLLAWGAAAAFGLFVGSGVLPGFELGADVGVAASVQAQPGAESDVGAAEVARADTDEEAASDDPDGTDWSDLELALGLGSEWEDEP